MTATTGTPLVRALITELRVRDADPGFVDAPVLDVYGRISGNPETGETEKVDRQIEDTLASVKRPCSTNRLASRQSCWAASAGGLSTSSRLNSFR